MRGRGERRKCAARQLDFNEIFSGEHSLEQQLQYSATKMHKNVGYDVKEIANPEKTKATTSYQMLMRRLASRW